MISGETLRLLRSWKGLAQKQAASLLNMSQPGYSKLEKKKEINGKTQEKIKNAFKCTDADIDRIKNLPPPRKMSRNKSSAINYPAFATFIA